MELGKTQSKKVIFLIVRIYAYMCNVVLNGID